MFDSRTKSYRTTVKRATESVTGDLSTSHSAADHYILFFFHSPRRNTNIAAIVMAASAAGIELNTPLGPIPTTVAKNQASGIWKHQ
jgi:hypothetical protein